MVDAIQHIAFTTQIHVLQLYFIDLRFIYDNRMATGFFSQHLEVTTDRISQVHGH